MATPHTRPLRADEVPHIPIDDPEITGYELVDGELVPVMGASIRHAWWVGEVYGALAAHVKQVGSGFVFVDPWFRLGIPRDPERLHAPDVAYYTSHKVEQERGEIFHVPPDLAVEAFSPSAPRRPGDFQRRVRDYVDARVRLLWIIFPEADYAMVLRGDGSARLVGESEALEGEDVLPGFRLELGPLFEGMPGPRP